MDSILSPILGIGFILGILFGIPFLDQMYKNSLKKTIDEVAKQYSYILKNFGIKKNERGNWEMTADDRNEIWQKK